MKILIIEDNPILSERIKNQLKRNFIVEQAFSGSEGLEQVVSSDFDCVVLDLGLPDINGFEVCKRIRELKLNIPILILTGVDTTSTKVELLDAGADDYLTKPFEFAELLARITAISRRQIRTPHEKYITAGDLVLEPYSRKVTRNNIPIKLRRKEFDILEYLAINQGRVMSRQMIINHAWSSMSESWIGSVDVHIKQLRDKIDRPFSYPLIRTSYGVGYMIEVPENLK